MAARRKDLHRRETERQLTHVSRFDMPAAISRKRDGHTLLDHDIESFIEGVVAGEVSHEQIGAMLMAIYLRGLDDHETTVLTHAMLLSGDTLDWSALTSCPVVDKHSSGGVGDKVSLILAPAMAALGCWVPMISGRGLGHTGGTLDKLEAIPGFCVEQSIEQMQAILENVGCCIVGQTKTLVPGDRILYSIRDITSTVGSTPLIVASILSKKAAEGLKALVLDVKVGTGAIMKTREEALALAKSMVAVGTGLGINTVAMLTEMDAPIGRAMGNAVEVVESVTCLHGQGPSDLEELVCVEGGQLLVQADMAESLESGAEKIRATLRDGSALAKFKAMLVAQGVTAELATAVTERPAETLLRPTERVTELVATESGTVMGIDAMPFALALGNMGAGRKTKEDALDFQVGAWLKVERGMRVEAGEVWAVIHHNMPLAEADQLAMENALHVSTDQEPSQPPSRILEVVHFAALQEVAPPQ